MYWVERESKYISLAWKVGLPPSTLAHLRSITSNFQKVCTYRTMQTPGGLLLAADEYNMLSIRIVERWKANTLYMLGN
jgi:hypothetical protein